MNDDEISQTLREHDDHLRDGDLILLRMEGKIDQVVDVVEDIKKSQAETHKRLFIDEDGRVSHQTKIDRHEMIIKGMLWVTGTFVVSIIGVVSAYLVKYFNQ